VWTGTDDRASRRARSPGRGAGADARGWRHRPASRRAPAPEVCVVSSPPRESLGVPHQLPPHQLPPPGVHWRSPGVQLEPANHLSGKRLGPHTGPDIAWENAHAKGQVGQTTWADRRGCHRPRSVSDNGRGRSAVRRLRRGLMLPPPGAVRSSIGRRPSPSRSATPVRAFGPVRWGPWLQTTLWHPRAG